MNRGDDELDLLLSGGRLRGPVADRERERVLDAVARRRPFWRRVSVVIPAFVVAAAASVLIVARPASESGEGRRDKGTPAGVVHELSCSAGTAAACPRGSRVSLVSRGDARGGYVGAYAEPEGGGERIWYFSSEDGSAVLPAQGPDPRLASRSIVLGPEHRPGPYRVVVLVADHPLARAEILAPGATVRVKTALRLLVVDR